VSQPEAFQALAEAERLLVQAEADPPAARDAALAALRALLLEWAQRPTGDTVTALLDQATRTDHTLGEFHAEAEVLDRFNPEPDAADRAKIFVDAARARMANI
jgi:hypothetical protein